MLGIWEKITRWHHSSILANYSLNCVQIISTLKLRLFDILINVVDKVLLESSKNPYTYMIFDVFGTLFTLEDLL